MNWLWRVPWKAEVIQVLSQICQILWKKKSIQVNHCFTVCHNSYHYYNTIDNEKIKSIQSKSMFYCLSQLLALLQQPIHNQQYVLLFSSIL